MGKFFFKLLFIYLRLFGVGVIFYLISYYVSASISLLAFKIANKEEISYKAILGETLKNKYLKILLNSLLKFLIFIGIYVTSVIIAVIIIILFGIIENFIKIILILFLVVFIIAAFGLMIWLYNSLTFSHEAIIYDNQGIASSLKKSLKLVYKNWWRVLGIILLISLVINFAVGIVTGPITFSAIFPAYLKMIKNIFNNNINDTYYFYMFTEYFTNIGPAIGISVWLSNVAVFLLYPIFKCLFYLDLKVRKNELKDQRNNTGEIDSKND